MIYWTTNSRQVGKTDKKLRSLLNKHNPKGLSNSRRSIIDSLPHSFILYSLQRLLPFNDRIFYLPSILTKTKDKIKK